MTAVDIEDVRRDLIEQHPAATEDELVKLFVAKALSDPAVFAAMIQYPKPGDQDLPDPDAIMQAIIDQHPGASPEELVKHWQEWWDADPALQRAVELDFVRTHSAEQIRRYLTRDKPN